MYLFTRRTRLAGGNGMAGVEWATAVCAKVTEVTQQEVQLWATVFSPGYGTLSWTAWFADLTSLESVGDALSADASYNALVDDGVRFTEGGLDDSLLQPLHGLPDPERAITYVGGVQAVMAGGQIGRAMAAGVELAMTADAITGLSTMFLRSVTGPYGSVGWLTGYESIAQAESADNALGMDPAWLKTVDGTEGCFVEDPSSTHSTMYRRLA